MERAAFDEVRATARTHEPDLYASALLAPMRARADLLALAAFAAEVRRIPLTVSDPNLALIRLQWWREAIERGPEAGATGNPVADAVLETMRRHRLASARLAAPLEAAETELAAEPHAAVAFAAYLDDLATAHFRMVSSLLGAEGGGPAGGGELIEAAGRAWAATQLALRLPYLAAMGRLPRLPGNDTVHDDVAGPVATLRAAVAAAEVRLVASAREDLARARSLWRRASARERLPVLPLALIEPYLAALERPGRDPLREPADIAPLTRMVRLWLAKRLGRV